jgi:acyl carrier protein
MNLDQILDAVEAKSISVETALKNLRDGVKDGPIAQFQVVTDGAPEFAASLKPELLFDLVSILAKVLEMDRADISPAVSVLDYGLDSVSATEYMVNLNRKAGINHPPTAFFECDTLDELADVLLRIYQNELRVFYAKDIPVIKKHALVSIAPINRQLDPPQSPLAEKDQLEIQDNPYSKDPLLHHLENCWQLAKTAIKKGSH